MLLIGSRAAQLFYPSFREPKDYDVFCTEEELNAFYKRNQANIKSMLMKSEHKFMCKLNDGTQVELEILCGRASNLFVDANYLFNPAHCYSELLGNYEVADPYVLFYLKKSHIGFNVHWDKNIKDYHFLKSNLDFILAPEQKGVLELAYQRRLAETDERHSKPKGIEPGVENDAFFNKYNVYRVIPHDSIHQAMAYFSAPLFIRLKRDINSAEVHEDLFNTLSHDDKVKCVQEEAFVLGIERVLIPNYSESITMEQFDNAFKYALRRLGTNLKDNPPFIKNFVIENYPAVINYNVNAAASKARNLITSIDFPSQAS